MTSFRLTRSLLSLLFFLALAGQASAGVKLTSKVQKGSLQLGGLDRYFLFYAPANLKERTTPLSLVLLLHGGAGTPKKMEKLTLGRFNELADRDGFVVVYPEGLGKSWNDGREDPISRAHRENIDDVGFLSALIDHFVARFSLDPKRVYVTGISNGAMMSLRLACELSDKIAAVAPVAGSLPAALAKTCRPAHPLSVMIINGDEDPLVPYAGGQVHLGKQKRGEVLPVPETARFWAERNACDPKAKEETVPDRDPADGTSMLKRSYSNPRNGTEVILYTLQGGGHTWPMGWKYLRERLVGRVSKEMDASDAIWWFFREHPKK